MILQLTRFPILFLFAGYAIIQIPDFILSLYEYVKKLLHARRALRSDEDQEVELGNCTDVTGLLANNEMISIGHQRNTEERFEFMSERFSEFSEDYMENFNVRVRLAEYQGTRLGTMSDRLVAISDRLCKVEEILDKEDKDRYINHY